MKLETENINYSAVVVKVNKLTKLNWLDNLLWLPLLWSQAVVSNLVKEWDIWLLFTSEIKLSDEFLSNNNLYRHNDLNKDKNIKGFFEDNWRVRAIKFKWNTSNAFFIPLYSLNYLWINLEELKVWDTFQSINWKEICTKYILQSKIKWINSSQQERRDWIVSSRDFPEHFQTPNFFRNEEKFKWNDFITVTQKLHWTSIRIWNILTKRKLSLIERITKFLWWKVEEMEYKVVTWSRRVNMSDDVINLYTEWRDEIKHLIPKWYILYWEVVWYEHSWKSIQTGYEYCLPQWVSDLYIYRITTINSEWLQIDLSWSSIKDFCNVLWLKTVPELWNWRVKNFDIDKFMDKNYYEEWFNNAVMCYDVDEWICIRKEWFPITVLKAKSPLFLEHETKLLDKWIENMEDVI